MKIQFLGFGFSAREHKALIDLLRKNAALHAREIWLGFGDHTGPAIVCDMTDRENIEGTLLCTMDVAADFYQVINKDVPVCYNHPNKINICFSTADAASIMEERLSIDEKIAELHDNARECSRFEYSLKNTSMILMSLKDVPAL